MADAASKCLRLSAISIFDIRNISFSGLIFLFLLKKLLLTVFCLLIIGGLREGNRRFFPYGGSRP